MKAEEIEPLLDKVAGLIAGSRRIVVFTGAGISTESGIPDFRSPGGIWERFDPDDFTYQKFISDAGCRRRQWLMLREGLLTDEALPNPAHHAIAELYGMGKLDCVITQNIDSLHQKSGLPDEKVFELHGNMRRVVCLECGRRFSFREVKSLLEAGEEIPSCESCGGILKPDVVLFGEQLPGRVFEDAGRRAMSADLFIVIGSTLVVYPAASLPGYAHAAGARLVIINLSATPLDHLAEAVVRAKAGEAMSGILRKLKENTG